MSITYQPKGYTGLMGRLGKLAGEAQAAQIEADRQEQRQAQMRQMQFQKEATFHREQIEQQALQMAQEWEVEKLRLRSQHDFQLAEEKYDLRAKYEIQQELRRQMEIDAQLDALKKQVGRKITPEDYARIEFELKTGMPMYSQDRRGSSNPIQDFIAQQLQQQELPFKQGLEQAAPGGGRILDMPTAIQFLEAAGGDKAVAYQMAVSQGYQVPE